MSKTLGRRRAPWAPWRLNEIAHPPKPWRRRTSNAGMQLGSLDDVGPRDQCTEPLEQLVSGEDQVGGAVMVRGSELGEKWNQGP